MQELDCFKFTVDGNLGDKINNRLVGEAMLKQKLQSNSRE